jgi:hypothetical protein
LLCLVAAAGAVWLWSRTPAGGSRTLLAAAGTLALLGPPAALAVRLDLLTGQVDTRVEALQWVLASVPLETKLAAESYSVPIVLDGSELEQRYRLTSFGLLQTPGQLQRLICGGNRYILTSSFQENRQRSQVRPGQPTGYDQLDQRARLVTTFWPGPDRTSPPFNLDDDGLPFWKIRSYERPGPAVKIYEIPPEACDRGRDDAGGCGDGTDHADLHARRAPHSSFAASSTASASPSHTRACGNVPISRDSLLAVVDVRSSSGTNAFSPIWRTQNSRSSGLGFSATTRRRTPAST